ncbi:MAG: septum site-determining protein MinC [Thiolinea sp.]
MLELKGEMSLLNVLLLHSADQESVTAGLQELAQQAQPLLQRSPVIVDCQQLGEQAVQLDFAALKTLVGEAGMIPVGMRNLPEELEAQAAGQGWALLRPGRSHTRTPPLRNEAAAEQEQQEAAGPRLKVMERPVRSGQQVYCPDGDIVVMQHTSAGSELLAGGSVHVYGALRGRVLAGIQGDATARIFCLHLEAELVAIAGRYRLLDDMEAGLKGQPAMVYLEDEKLKIVPI